MCAERRFGNATESGSNAAAPQATQTEARVESLRLKIAEDSKRVRAIASMVSSVFENN